ncbi:MAG: LPS export ABC transporter periplasmic protein LptC [Psychrilyobacter sp.]|uniref:LPS export ABC transporter periplasmic protein LptC n=1 Tax=Psychrilyobacter sp. TaxID=2586924 RepID=UPI003C765544
MLKKISYYISGILLVVFVYFNYIKEPEQIEKKSEESLITSNVSYDVENYHVEAEKQIDDTVNDRRTFKKAAAIFDRMKLSGDNALVDSTNNIFLEKNIMGISKNGWKIEAEKANYNHKTEKIYASNQVKAYNENEGITLYGNSLITDTKLEDLNLKDDIRVVTDKMQLSANLVNYNDTTKILDVKENIRIRGRKLGNLQTDEVSGHFREARYDGIKKTIHAQGDFVVYYKGANLRAKDFKYNEITGDFTISKDIVIEFENGNLVAEKINYVANENKMYFTGPLRGKNGDFNLVADNGVYDNLSGILKIDGNIKIDNKTSKLLADSGTYDTKTGDLYMTSKKLVSYEDLDRKILTKNFTYNSKTKELKLLNSYDYKDTTYESIGKELYYDDGTKIGKVIDGTFKGDQIDGRANKVDFNLEKKAYVFTGDAMVTYSGSILKSQRIDVDDLNKKANIYGKYTVYNPKDKITFYGENAEYKIDTGDLISNGRIKVVQDKKVMTGENLSYNSNTGLGKIEKNRVIVDEDGSEMVGDRGEFDTNDYAEIIGNLKITTKDATLYANRGKYIFAEEKVNIPGDIKIISKDGKANMNDGIYFVADKRVKAKNFSGISGDKKASGDEVNYYISRQVAQLNKNVVVQNPGMKFTGSQVEYSFITDDIYTSEKYKIYYANYIIDGETMKGNMKSEILDGTKVNLVSSTGEQLYGDFMFGDLKNKQIDLDGNVRAIAFNIDKKTQKKEPVKIRGDTIKIFLYEDVNGKLSISRSEIKKKGIYEYQDMTLYSDYMEVDLIKKLALGRYGNHLNIGETTDVKSEITDIDMNTEIAILINNVEFKNINKDGKIMTASSDKGKIFNKTKVAVLRENVVADTIENHIESDSAKYFMETGILNAEGNVRIDYKK